ncbi:DUF6069 family protein [Streptomyces sp. NPDC020801]|uniref:DUF6069 family protein n=1 Tax=unclassified Streptomyces TaxID=2593676 RepID=UPI003789773C
MTTSPSRPATPDLRRTAYAICGAVLATALLWAVADGMGVDLRVDPGNGLPTQTVGLPLVAGSTLFASLLAALTRKGLDRLTDRARTVWTRLAVTVLLVSLAPLTFVQASDGAKATLALMHLAIAAVLIPLLGRRDGD